MTRREFVGHGTVAGLALLAKTPELRAAPAAVPLIDPDRIPQIRGVCDFVISRMDARGRYVPEEAFWAETIGYRSSMAAYLALAGQRLKEPRYVRAAERMLDGLLPERIGDGWPVGWWAEFPTYEGTPIGWRESYLTKPDLRYTALTVAALGMCYQAGGARRFMEPARRGLASLFSLWDFEKEKNTALHLSFEVVALAVSAWETVFPEYAAKKQAILKWVLDTYVETARADFPFLTMYRTMLVLSNLGATHLHSHLRPGLDALLAEKRWRCPEDPRYFFHNKATAGHVNIRGNVAVAITMRALDEAAGERFYTATETYRHLADWLDGLRRDDGAYYGAREHGEGRRFDLGSPAQYLPLCWMLGGLGSRRPAAG